MFQAKVSYHKKMADGRVQRFEKEFDNERDYWNFLSSNSNLLSTPRFLFPQFKSIRHWIWSSFLPIAYIDDILDYVNDGLFGTYLPNDQYEKKCIWNECDVWLNEYEREVQKIEYEKAHREEKIQNYKNKLQKLEEYKKIFKQEWKEELFDKVEKDIKKIKEEMKKFEEKNDKSNN